MKQETFDKANYLQSEIYTLQILMREQESKPAFTGCGCPKYLADKLNSYIKKTIEKELREKQKQFDKL